jgi:hypothetical protein
MHSAKMRSSIINISLFAALSTALPTEQVEKRACSFPLVNGYVTLSLL